MLLFSDGKVRFSDIVIIGIDSTKCWGDEKMTQLRQEEAQCYEAETGKNNPKHIKVRRGEERKQMIGRRAFGGKCKSLNVFKKVCSYIEAEVLLDLMKKVMGSTLGLHGGFELRSSLSL